MESEPVALPGRDRGVHLHGIVVLTRVNVSRIDRDLGLGQRAVGVAAVGFPRPPCLF